ncbi:MAG: hypothetical protein JST28_23190 [Acidobacteria bacterium]|nr:hypothetical protein [Acidobacteriota bacterium]
MFKFACFLLVVVAVEPTWSQVEPAATGSGSDLDNLHMMTPPPVSTDAYPVVVGAESRTNFLDAGLVFTGSYVDNLLEGPSAISDEVYYFLPSITLDRTTPRHSESLRYSPGFTLYQKTSELNGISQDASGEYRFHVTPYTVIQFSDRFWQNYNTYNQSNPFVAGGITGAPGNTTLLAPFANQMNNLSTIAVDYQYARNSMIGGSGSYSFLRYTGNDTQLTGLNDGNTTEATAFYSRRTGRAEYLGAVYQFTKLVTHPVDTHTDTHTLFGFYTHYFTQSFSLSVLGGPEHYLSDAAGFAKEQAWTPAAQGILGWQTLRTNLGFSFAHLVSGAPGLNGAFHADMARMTGEWRFKRSWSMGMDGEYSLLKSIITNQYPGGHTVSGGAYLDRRIGERTEVVVGYGHVHESYRLIPSSFFSPDSNRVYASVKYGFHRPLGR